MTIIAAAILAISVLFAPQGRPGGRVAGGWEGLIHHKALDAVPRHKTKRVGTIGFAYGVVHDRETLDRFNRVADAKPYNAVHDWKAWADSINFDREVVVVVARTAPTNLIKLKSVAVSRSKRWMLNLRFSAIEPSYGEHYPVVLYRLPRDRRSDALISVDQGGGKDAELGVVPLHAAELE